MGSLWAEKHEKYMIFFEEVQHFIACSPLWQWLLYSDIST